MHPYAIDRMVQERREELLRLGQADRGVRAARAARRTRVPAWRRAAGRALVTMAVAAGVPRPRRRAARRQATTVLGLEPPC